MLRDPSDVMVRCDHCDRKTSVPEMVILLTGDMICEKCEEVRARKFAEKVHP